MYRSTQRLQRAPNTSRNRGLDEVGPGALSARYAAAVRIMDDHRLDHPIVRDVKRTPMRTGKVPHIIAHRGYQAQGRAGTRMGQIQSMGVQSLAAHSERL